MTARAAELRPVYLPPDPASRTSYAPGEIAQCDLWFPPITLPIVSELPVVGRLVFGHNPLVYGSLALFVAVQWFLGMHGFEMAKLARIKASN